MKKVFASLLVLLGWSLYGESTWVDDKLGIKWTYQLSDDYYYGDDQDWTAIITKVEPFDKSRPVTEVKVPAYIGEFDVARVVEIRISAFNDSCFTNLTPEGLTFATNTTKIVWDNLSYIKNYSKWWADQKAAGNDFIWGKYFLLVSTNAADRVVTVPEGVEVIISYALSDAKVTGVVLPDSLRRLDAFALWNSSIKDLTLPDAMSNDEINYHSLPGQLERLTLGAGFDRFSVPSKFGCESTLKSIDMSKCGCMDVVPTFKGFTALESVKLPDSIYEVPKNAFYGCTNLKQIDFSGTELFSIGELAFAYSGLESINLPSSLELIGKNAFLECSALMNIDLSKTEVRQISDYAFMSSGLSSIDFPTNLVYIGERAFGYCASLTSVKIPEGVKHVGWRAFVGCAELTSVKIPSSIEVIEDGVFYECSKLKNVDFAEGCVIKELGDEVFAGTIYGGAEDPHTGPFELIVVPGGWCIGYTGHPERKLEFTEEDGVSNICSSAFATDDIQTNVEEIVFSDSVANIQDWAFSANDIYPCMLRKVSFGSGLCLIDDYSFSAQSNLQSVTFADDCGLQAILSHSFSECDSLLKLELPDGLTYIGDNAFSACTSLSEVKFPEGLEHIDQEAFCMCEELTTVEFPEDCELQEIGWGAFYGCKKLRGIELPDEVYEIGGCAFENCVELRSVSIPSNILFICNGCFAGCEKLSKVKVADGARLLKVGWSAFAGTPFLEESDEDFLCLAGVLLRATDVRYEGVVEIPTNVVVIAPQAFLNTNPRQIVIPESVRQIWDGAFCSNATYSADSYPAALKVIACANRDVEVREGSAMRNLFKFTNPLPGYIFSNWMKRENDVLDESVYVASWSKVSFRTDPTLDGDFVGNATYTGWLKSDERICGQITAKTSAIDDDGYVKVTVTITFPGGKKVYNKKVEVNEDDGKVYLNRFLKGMVLGGSWLSGEIELEGVEYQVEGGVDLAPAVNSAYCDGLVGTWNAAFSCSLSGNGYDGAGTFKKRAPLARGTSIVTVSVAKGGKVKATCVFADGTKASTTSKLVVGDNGAACAPISFQAYAGKAGGFGFLFWVYKPEGEASPVAFIDDEYGIVGRWVFPVGAGREPWVYLEMDCEDISPISKNPCGLYSFDGKGWEFISDSFTTEVSRKFDTTALYPQFLDAISDTKYSLCNPGLIADAKGKWVMASTKAPKLKFYPLGDLNSLYPEEIAGVVHYAIANPDDAPYCFAADGKYYTAIFDDVWEDEVFDGDFLGWLELSGNIVTEYSLGYSGNIINEYTFESGKYDVVWELSAANINGLKLSYNAKTGLFTGSYTINYVQSSDVDTPVLKKTTATINGAVINGVGYANILIKGVGSTSAGIFPFED